MIRKILAWTLIVLSSIFLLLSVTGIAAAWIYNEPLTRAAINQLNKIDGELLQAQSTLESTHVELNAPCALWMPHKPHSKNLQNNPQAQRVCLMVFKAPWMINCSRS